MAGVVLNGSTSGSVTLDPPAVAGSTVITLPSTSGTMLLNNGNGSALTNVTATNLSGGSIDATTGTFSGYVFKPNQPAFYAHSGGAGPSGYSSPTTAQFSTIITNIGSGFNNSTHRFTAPVAGRYLISASASFGNNSTLNTWVAIRLYKNGSVLSAENYMLGHVSNTGSSNNYDNVSGVVIVALAAGDYLHVSLEHSVFNGSMTYGHFCGYLIS